MRTPLRTSLLIPTVLFCLLASASTASTDANLSSLPDPTLILHSGIVIPMTLESARFEAIAIAGDTILALGSDEEVLALATPETELVDLGGAALFPGFIDPHTHLFDSALAEGMTFDEVQQMALENGITAAANMHTAPDEGNPWEIDDFIAYADAGGMRLRLYLYLIHTNGCGETEGFWYEQYAPEEEIAPGLHMGGVKLFAEQSICNGTIDYTFSEDARRALPEKGRQRWADASLIRSEEELVEVLERVQANGYQAAIHAIGDLAAETCLNAYETVLAGKPNTLRHMILHNHFLQDDMLPRYAELGVIALVEMSSPAMLESFSELVGEENLSLFRRWDELLSTGAHVALDSDWPYFPISPIDKLRAFVGGESVHPGVLERTRCPCPDRIPQTVTMWQGLQMMTTSAAYALRIEDTLGSLEPGKLADLVILTGDPLGIEPSQLSELVVTATYVDGKLEYSDGAVVAEYDYLREKAAGQSLQVVIRSDEDFEDRSSGITEGSGTADDPYVIRDRTISGGLACIRIENTTKHFVIRNCTVEGDGNGILIAHAKNGVVEGCVVRSGTSNCAAYGDPYGSCGDGICIFESEQITVTGCCVEGSDASGISFYGSSYCIVQNNWLIANGASGIEISRESFSCEVSDNWLQGNGWNYGSAALKIVTGSHDNTAHDNEFLTNVGGNSQVTGDSNSAASRGELECAAIDLKRIDWLPSINEDNNPNPIDNYAKMTQGIDSYGDYYSMEWNSPKPVDLSLNELQWLDWEGARAFELTLSSDSPMDVKVWISVSGDYCGRNWRNVVGDAALSVDNTPRTFAFPRSLFDQDPSGVCEQKLADNALETMYSIVLWPSSRAGELCVYDVSICRD